MEEVDLQIPAMAYIDFTACNLLLYDDDLASMQKLFWLDMRKLEQQHAGSHTTISLYTDRRLHLQKVAPVIACLTQGLSGMLWCALSQAWGKLIRK